MSAERFDKIIQIGLVVPDKEKVINSMREVFGVEPAKINRSIQDENRMYRGKHAPFLAETLIYKFANIDIEFIVPLEGPSIWHEWLEEHGGGLHHIMFDVDDWDGAVSDMAKSDIHIMQEGSSQMKIPGVKYGYFDSFDKLSFIIEMRNGKNHVAKPPQENK